MLACSPPWTIFFSFPSSQAGLSSLEFSSFCLLVLPLGTCISIPSVPEGHEPAPNPRLSLTPATSLSTVAQLSEYKASPKLSHSSAPHHRPHPLPWETGTLVSISLPLTIPQPTHQESPWLSAEHVRVPPLLTSPRGLPGPRSLIGSNSVPFSHPPDINSAPSEACSQWGSHL